MNHELFICDKAMGKHLQDLNSTSGYVWVICTNTWSICHFSAFRSRQCHKSLKHQFQQPPNPGRDELRGVGEDARGPRHNVRGRTQTCSWEESRGALVRFMRLCCDQITTDTWEMNLITQSFRASTPNAITSLMAAVIFLDVNNDAR